MILCTSTELSLAHLCHTHKLIGEEVWYGEIKSLPPEKREKVKILVISDTCANTMTGNEWELLPNLQWIHGVSARIEKLPLEFMATKKIVLTFSSEAYVTPFSEYVLAMILFFTKRIEKYQFLKESMVWDYSGGMNEIRGKTIGIMGTDAIGCAIAEKVQTLGMIPIGINNHGNFQAEFERVYALHNLDSCLPHCDFLCSVLPPTLKTRNLINAERIGQMKEEAILINVGHGDLIVEEDLIHALQTGRIAGAALDVLRDQPLPYNHPLWHLDNLVITPNVLAKTDRHTLLQALAIFEKDLNYFKSGIYDKMTGLIEFA